MSATLSDACEVIFRALEQGQLAVVEVREDEGGRRSIAFGAEGLPMVCCTATAALGLAKTFEAWSYLPNLVELLRLAAFAIDPAQEVNLQ